MQEGTSDAPDLLSAENYIKTAGQLADTAETWVKAFGENVTTEFRPDDYKAIADAFGLISNSCIAAANVLSARMTDSSP